MRFVTRPVCLGAVSLGVVISATLFASSLLSGCGGLSQGHFLTELYQYFPKDSSLYVEFKPSDKDAQKMLSAVDKLAGRYGAFAGRMPAKQGKVALQAQQIAHQVTHVFNKDFQSQMAMGYWIDNAAQTAPESKATGLKEHSLAILPLKPGVTADVVIKDLNLVVAKPVVVNTKAGQLTTYLETNNKLTYAVNQNELLIAQDKNTLVDALNLKGNKDQYLMASEVVTKNLGRLSSDRQGTIIIQQNKQIKALQEKHIEDQLKLNGKNAAQNDFVSELVKQLDDISAGSVGGLGINTRKLLVSVDMYTPMDFTKIKNETLRGHIQSFYTTNGHTNLADVLSDNTALSVGVNGFDHILSLYENVIENTDQASVRLDMAKNQLKAIGLDWQQNVLGMFKGTTALVLNNQPAQIKLPSFMLLLNNSSDTQKTMDTLVKKISPMAGAPVEKSFNGKKLSALSSPLLPAGIMFGDVGSGLYALGISQAVQSLPALGNNVKLSSSEGYKILSEGVSPNSVFYIYANWKGLAQQIPNLASMTSLPVDLILVSGSWDAGVSHGQFRMKLDDLKL